MVVAAEKELADTKAADQGRPSPGPVGDHARRAERTPAKADRELEKKQRKQRQQIFEVEDQIAEKRDQLIDGLQRRMSQKTKSTPLFTIQWRVV